MNTYDYIIVGAGASGLITAYRMSQDIFFDDKTILLIDKEKKSKNDRTWCFWEESNGEWDDILSTSWGRIIFKSHLHSAENNIAPYRYKMIRSKGFYQKIWNKLAKNNNITFLEESVKSVHQEHKKARVITSKNVFYSRNVINSILFSNAYQKQNKYPVLQQHFVGFFIKTKEDFFDDSAATFMDFTIPQKGNTRFMYILPYSKNKALFEYTLFSESLLPYNEYKIAIESYLLEKGIKEYEIIEKEKGSIPMTAYKFWEKNSKNIIHIGTAGGWSKASTGFTFKNITKKSRELIYHLKVKKPFNKFYIRNKFWFYDLLLLDILHEKNHLGAKIFGHMFKNNQPKKIFKFLDEETNFIEDLQIQLKMPPYEFVRALFKRIF
ncbi:lycopene cyclase family protein [Polaribacter aquimarinus]|uniref:Lycopene cyclase n=1 Tax=Polaribacter aquimarinus TaxID=2100726 RepID=A0A2U2J9M8_9FLAO|nr:lycopene cyclase family protein [Polaribacter aquimarinus]PWG05024.1 lycopene cyclase [Polaribacter aquimarinus]